MSPPSLEAAKGIIEKLRKAGYEAYLVGGCVRDLIRGVPPGDYDIVASARPEEVQALFPHSVPVGASFGVILVLEAGHGYEVATFRKDGDYLDGRRPTEVKYVHAREDVLRRDFTINGLLMDPTTGEIIDHVDGRGDIERGIIRTIGEAGKRFAEDHLRILRAVRLASGLDFQIDPATFAAIKNNAPKILLISAERIREELMKILTQGGARRGLELLAETGLLEHLLPEVAAMRGVEQPALYHPEGDVWEHTLRMLALLSRRAPDGDIDESLAWGVLLHDVGKFYTRSEDERGVHFYNHVSIGKEVARAVMKRLRFAGRLTDAVLALIHYHMFFLNVQKMRTTRLKRFLRLPDFDLHLELHRLDCLGSHGRLDNYYFCKDRLVEFSREDLHPLPLINGRDLITLGFKPGPLFKKILKTVEDAQLENRITSPSEARQLVMARFGRQG